MSDDVVVQVEDPPVPALPDLQQRDLTALPHVPVVVVTPVRVQPQPARSGPATNETLTTTPQMVLSADPRRSAATLICDEDWLYRSKQSGLPVTWPANVPMVVTHCDAVWAAVATGDATLGVIVELYAQ